METKSGEANVQKVKNWSPVWIFPDRHGADRRLDTVLPLQPSGAGGDADYHQRRRH
ncbi:Uncharacterised protein [Kluyvera cryocrescens]|uniref:Uncharacterized protein n=1 Tax=Kluyvera cryocrescens TaxID=580 RepID=A0A485CWP4_KLUCR|nr:Uncharacterised protein [Kluyvera cryocrescens]